MQKIYGSLCNIEKLGEKFPIGAAEQIKWKKAHTRKKKMKIFALMYIHTRGHEHKLKQHCNRRKKNLKDISSSRKKPLQWHFSAHHFSVGMHLYKWCLDSWSPMSKPHIPHFLHYPKFWVVSLFFLANDLNCWSTRKSKFYRFFRPIAILYRTRWSMEKYKKWQQDMYVRVYLPYTISDLNSHITKTIGKKCREKNHWTPNGRQIKEENTSKPNKPLYFHLIDSTCRKHSRPHSHK